MLLSVVRRVVVPVLLCASVAGCAGSGKPSAGPTPSAAVEPTPTVAPCPGANNPTKLVWPADFPQNLPKPPSATAAVPVASQLNGLKIVRFTTSTSIREGVLFVIKAVPKAGFTLGRGDAEPFEADAPWQYGNLRGTYRMSARDDCQTQWLVAVARQGVGGGSPLLPTPTGSPSPLPFAP